MKKIVIILIAAVISAFSPPAQAWNANGHKLVGSIADGLLNPSAKQQVAQILGVDLRTAGPWLDCVKSVQRGADGQLSRRNCLELHRTRRLPLA